MRFNRQLFKEAFKQGYKAARKKLNEGWDYEDEEAERKERFDNFEDDGEFAKYENFPDWALDYCVNGVADGLTDEELEQVQNFEHEVGEVVDWSGEKYFSSRPLFGLACDCVDVIVRLNGWKE